jgi:hypothetical protein
VIVVARMLPAKRVRARGTLAGRVGSTSGRQGSPARRSRGCPGRAQVQACGRLDAWRAGKQN